MRHTLTSDCAHSYSLQRQSLNRLFSWFSHLHIQQTCFIISANCLSDALSVIPISPGGVLYSATCRSLRDAVLPPKTKSGIPHIPRASSWLPNLVSSGKSGMILLCVCFQTLFKINSCIQISRTTCCVQTTTNLKNNCFLLCGGKLNWQPEHFTSSQQAPRIMRELCFKCFSIWWAQVWMHACC